MTVGSIHGGTKHNIIPDEVKLQLTLRIFQRAGPPAAHRRHQAPGRSGWPRPIRPPSRPSRSRKATPPTINTPALVERVVPAFVEALGPANVKPAKPVMGAEDFALYSEGNVPICMFWLGTIEPRAARGGARQGRRPARPPLVEVLSRARARASPPASAP